MAKISQELSIKYLSNGHVYFSQAVGLLLSIEEQSFVCLQDGRDSSCFSHFIGPSSYTFDSLLAAGLVSDPFRAA